MDGSVMHLIFYEYSVVKIKLSTVKLGKAKLHVISDKDFGGVLLGDPNCHVDNILKFVYKRCLNNLLSPPWSRFRVIGAYKYVVFVS